jgi:hypothetical protein
VYLNISLSYNRLERMVLRRGDGTSYKSDWGSIPCLGGFEYQLRILR